jgi:hypothetical protein
MGSDPLMAALGLRISLIAYPVVALSKVRGSEGRGCSRRPVHRAAPVQSCWGGALRQGCGVASGRITSERSAASVTVFASLWTLAA